MAYSWTVYLIACAAYFIGWGVCWSLGFRMHIPYEYLQLLEPAWLENQFAESIFYLHAQPPALNVALGLALKFSRSILISPEAILLVIHTLLGGIIVIGFAYLANVLIGPWKVRLLAIGAFIVNPVFYLSLFTFFYPFHELLLLILSAVAIHHFVVGGFTSRHFAVVCILAVALVYTRALFHFIWAIAFLAPLAWIGKPNARRKTLTIYAITSFLLLAWPLKNLILFGQFSYSTWQGYNFARDISVGLLDGPELRDAPTEYQHVASLSTPTKSNGFPNWNHYGIIGASREAGESAKRKVLKEPWLLLRRAMVNYDYYTRFAGRNPYQGSLGFPMVPLPGKSHAWFRAYEKWVLFDFRVAERLAHPDFGGVTKPFWAVSGFYLIFPAVLFAALWRIHQIWRENRINVLLPAFMLYCVLWVLLLCLVVDGMEANRHRFSTGPFLLLLAFWAVSPKCSRFVASATETA